MTMFPYFRKNTVRTHKMSIHHLIYLRKRHHINIKDNKKAKKSFKV